MATLKMQNVTKQFGRNVIAVKDFNLEVQEKEFLVGNVREHSFQYMWDHSTIFSSLRNLSVNACRTCSRFEVCRGGCPAMAFHTYHSIHMPDPECLVNLRKMAV